MIKFSKLTDYAVVVLATLSQSDRLMSAHCLSEETHLPEPTVSKVLKLLAKANVVKSMRGVNGGYDLPIDASQLSILRIVTAIDGPVNMSACVDTSKEYCDFSDGCPVHGRWDGVNDAIKSAIDSFTLADMIRDDYKISKSNNSKTEESVQA
ncbi:MAG: SUF system Fe-S cluster assembly regulator [Pseudomonadota bacterium]